MSVRAGIVVTGTEVLSGRVVDRNGPWLSERLRDIGVELAHTTIVGDRPADVLGALEWCRDLGLDLVLTSGGLGPTADDLTASVVGGFAGREMILDEALEARIGEILASVMARYPHVSREAMLAANRKQAIVPSGATVLEPIGTAPGLVVPPLTEGGGPTVVVLPGPPRELTRMWEAAVQADAFKHAVAGAARFTQRTLRIYGPPESEIAETLRAAEAQGVALSEIEVTTCVRSGEIEIVSRFEPHTKAIYERFEEVVRERHGRDLFSDDGSRVSDQVASLLRGQGRTVAVAESCTGGLIAARLTDLPGSSEYVRGGLVVYDNEAKQTLAGVSAALLERCGAVSGEVAAALAAGARTALGADVGVGVTGVAGPGGGTPEKPVGLVWTAVVDGDGRHLVRSYRHHGSRGEVRERSVTAAMHLLRRVLTGESDAGPAEEGPDARARRSTSSVRGAP